MKREERNQAQISDFDDEHILHRAERVFIAIALFAAFVLLTFFANFLLPDVWRALDAGNLIAQLKASKFPFGEGSAWGEFGDFAGGILNPAIGIATIYLILVNVRFQKRELRLALDEMKNSNKSLATQNHSIEVQNFQNAFFNWINTYHNTVSAASFPTAYGFLSGAPAFRAAYNKQFNGENIQGQFEEEDLYFIFEPFSDYRFSVNANESEIVEEILLTMWHDLQWDNYAIESAMKSLIGLINWILTRAPSSDVEKEYVEILSSQLSQVELSFLLYETWRVDKHLYRKLERKCFFKKLQHGRDPALYFIRLRSENF